MLDLGLLIVRVVVGALLSAHGAQKLFGWFGGPGLDGNAGMLASLGYRRPHVLSRLHALAEAGAGALLVLGLLTPLAAAATIAVMLNAAVAVHANNGLWVQDGGYEYPLVLATVAGGLALTGPGAVALDAILGWELTGAWAVVGVLAGLIVGAAVLATRRRPEPVGIGDRGRSDVVRAA